MIDSQLFIQNQFTVQYVAIKSSRLQISQIMENAHSTGRDTQSTSEGLREGKQYGGWLCRYFNGLLGLESWSCVSVDGSIDRHGRAYCGRRGPAALF